MNPSREEALFTLALEKPVKKRPVFLDAVCEGDPALRARLDALLAAHEEPESLAGPNKATVRLQFDDEPAPAEQVGSLVGRYKLLEKLGVGGFGEVWAAEHHATEPPSHNARRQFAEALPARPRTALAWKGGIHHQRKKR